LKKVNENYSHELKPASTTTKMKVAKVRAEPKTIGTANVNAAAMLPWRCCWSDKFGILFEPRHARWLRSHFHC